MVGDILGGVPKPLSAAAKSHPFLRIAAAAPAPGKLRVVENSGICGKFTQLPIKLRSLSETHCYRDNPRRLSGLRLWRSDGHEKYLVRSRSPIFHHKTYVLTISLQGFGSLQLEKTRIPRLFPSGLTEE